MDGFRLLNVTTASLFGKKVACVYVRVVACVCECLWGGGGAHTYSMLAYLPVTRACTRAHTHTRTCTQPNEYIEDAGVVVLFVTYVYDDVTYVYDVTYVTYVYIEDAGVVVLFVTYAYDDVTYVMM